MTYWPPILKLTPGRHERRLRVIARGAQELNSFVAGAPSDWYRHLCMWGLIEKAVPVHFLDDYEGYRPTRRARRVLRYDAQYHLIFVERRAVQALMDRYMAELNAALAFNARMLAAR